MKNTKTKTSVFVRVYRGSSGGTENGEPGLVRAGTGKSEDLGGEGPILRHVGDDEGPTNKKHGFGRSAQSAVGVCLRHRRGEDSDAEGRVPVNIGPGVVVGWGKL